MAKYGKSGTWSGSHDTQRAANSGSLDAIFKPPNWANLQDGANDAQ
jgi:hypothetical protein